MTRRTLEEGVTGLTGEVSNKGREFVKQGESKSKKKHGGGSPPPKLQTRSDIRQAYSVKLRVEVYEKMKLINMFSEFRGEKLTMQDIMEQAVEEWMERNEHLAEVPSTLQKK